MCVCLFLCFTPSGLLCHIETSLIKFRICTAKTLHHLPSLKGNSSPLKISRAPKGNESCNPWFSGVNSLLASGRVNLSNSLSGISCYHFSAAKLTSLFSYDDMMVAAGGISMRYPRHLLASLRTCLMQWASNIPSFVKQRSMGIIPPFHGNHSPFRENHSPFRENHSPLKMMVGRGYKIHVDPTDLINELSNIKGFLLEVESRHKMWKSR